MIPIRACLPFFQKRAMSEMMVTPTSQPPAAISNPMKAGAVGSNHLFHNTPKPPARVSVASMIMKTRTRKPGTAIQST